MRVVLYDIDGRIPNLALMKLAAWHRARGDDLIFQRMRAAPALPARIDGDLHYASAVFRTPQTSVKIAQLRQVYGDRIDVGGSGHSLEKRLPAEVETQFPDYPLYGHHLYALGFLTRGCNKRCAFCIVPAKEGRLKLRTSSFDDFVPPSQRNVMLLDDNLLAYTEVEGLLQEMIDRRYAVNFSQTLDIAYLTDRKYERLRQIDYQSARFSNRMIYFSLNYSRTIHHFMDRREMLRGFGRDCVTVVCIYGFDTHLSEDYERWRCLRQLGLIPFFQEYWPVEGVPDRLPENFFDMDLEPVIRLTFRSNGYNWEKYLRWLNHLYFRTYGKYYRPLVEIIHRYNNKERITPYLDRPEILTTEVYRDFRAENRRPVRGSGRHPSPIDPAP